MESFRSHDEPDWMELRVTVPEYIELPVPFFTSSQEVMTAPVLASTTVCSRLGVWSARIPSVTTSHASRGDPAPAHTTSSPSFTFAVYPARRAPADSAVVSPTLGVV